MVLEWDPVELATADLRSLSLYRNGSKAGVIPRPFENTSTKISGLAVDTEYTFSLVLRTSAGTFGSEKLTVRTHKMTDLSGITITPGVMAPELHESLGRSVNNMGAKLIDTVRIDTTHFVCSEGRGAAWEKAVEMNVPVVLPDWVKGCEREGRIVGVRGYYLNADPKLRQVGPGVSLGRQDSQSSLPQQQTPRTEITPPTPERGRAQKDESESSDDESEQAVGRKSESPAPPARATNSSGASPTVNADNSETASAASEESDGDITNKMAEDETEKDDQDESETEEPPKAPPTPGQFEEVDL